MSSKRINSGRWRERRRLVLGVVAVAGLLTAALVAGALTRDSAQNAAPRTAQLGERELPAAITKKLARAQRFAPAETRYEAGEAGTEEVSDGADDWLKHAAPGNDIPLAAISGSREDWAGLKSRGNSAGVDDHGPWTNLGPDNAVYPLNPFRNRYVYVPNEYVAAGRTAHSVIDPNCSASKCRYWIANAGGGIWRTENAFAAQPEWEFLSPVPA